MVILNEVKDLVVKTYGGYNDEIPRYARNDNDGVGSPTFRQQTTYYPLLTLHLDLRQIAECRKQVIDLAQ